MMTFGGLVAESQIIDARSTIADKDVRECVQESMYALRFPPPGEGGEVHIEFPFTLLSPDHQSPPPEAAPEPD